MACFAPKFCFVSNLSPTLVEKTDMFAKTCLKKRHKPVPGSALPAATLERGGGRSLHAQVAYILQGVAWNVQTREKGRRVMQIAAAGGEGGAG